VSCDIVVATFKEPAGRVREHLLDLTAENKSIASKHRLHPKTRSSVLQAIENWFGGVRQPPVESSSRVMLVHGPAGSGKTCLSAELCRRYSSRRKLLIGHFFHWRAGRPDHNRAVSVLLGLAHRMCELVTGYDEQSLHTTLCSYCRLYLYDKLTGFFYVISVSPYKS